MIPVSDIRKFYKIIDREIALLELRENMNPKLKKILLDNWTFIRNTFQAVCYDCALAEGLIKKRE